MEQENYIKPEVEIYEVEVEQGEAVIQAEYDAALPVAAPAVKSAPAAAPTPVAAPAPAAVSDVLWGPASRWGPSSGRGRFPEPDPEAVPVRQNVPPAMRKAVRK